MLLPFRWLLYGAAARTVAQEESSGGALPDWQLLDRYLRRAEPVARGDARLLPARARAKAGKIVAIGGIGAATAIQSARASARAAHTRAEGFRLAVLQNARAKARAEFTIASGGAVIDLKSATIIAFPPEISARGARNFTNDELVALLLAA